MGGAGAFQFEYGWIGAAIIIGFIVLDAVVHDGGVLALACGGGDGVEGFAACFRTLSTRSTGTSSVGAKRAFAPSAVDDASTPARRNKIATRGDAAVSHDGDSSKGSRNHKGAEGSLIDIDISKNHDAGAKHASPPPPPRHQPRPPPTADTRSMTYATWTSPRLRTWCGSSKDSRSSRRNSRAREFVCRKELKVKV